MYTGGGGGRGGGGDCGGQGGPVTPAAGEAAIAQQMKGLTLTGPKQIFSETALTLPRRPNFGTAGRYDDPLAPPRALP